MSCNKMQLLQKLQQFDKNGRQELLNTPSLVEKHFLEAKRALRQTSNAQVEQLFENIE